MEHDQDSICTVEEMGRDECLELLANADIGRIGVVVDGQPMIFPVNFILDGELVVFRSAPGIKLDHAALDRVVFEVDKIDPTKCEGWSVLVTGLAREITDALDEASIRERSTPLLSWAGGPKDHWVRVTGPNITGRHVHQ